MITGPNSAWKGAAIFVLALAAAVDFIAVFKCAVVAKINGAVLALGIAGFAWYLYHKWSDKSLNDKAYKKQIK